MINNKNIYFSYFLSLALSQSSDYTLRKQKQRKTDMKEKKCLVLMYFENSHYFLQCVCVRLGETGGAAHTHSKPSFQRRRRVRRHSVT